MKTIGIIGGMSWESSLEYYRIVNEAVKARLGGLHSADCLMYSLDFAEIEALQMANQWEQAGDVLAAAAQRLERGGADCIVLATNTMHLVADAITNAVSIPLLHIADATAKAIQAAGVNHVLLLGTRFTMEKPFMRQRMQAQFGLTVSVPDDAGRTTIHDIIYNELVLGKINERSRGAYQQVIEQTLAAGVEGVILGCTEIGLLIQQQHVSVPVFDTTRIHAEAAVSFALEGN